MGDAFEFKCSKCGYTVEACGGTECGMRVTLTTIECLDCRKLADVVTHQFKSVLDSIEIRPCCLKSAKHRIRLWKSGDPCPRCQGAMKKTGLASLWD